MYRPNFLETVLEKDFSTLTEVEQVNGRLPLPLIFHTFRFPPVPALYSFSFFWCYIKRLRNSSVFFLLFHPNFRLFLTQKVTFICNLKLSVVN